MKRLHIYFSGRVQGVGFRYTTRQLARGLDLRGWVRNLPDGRVEMLAEGPEADINALLDGLEGRFSITAKEQKAPGSEALAGSFEIR